MKNRNCPNCGAPLESEVCKCPYCGTSYFDFSALNIKDGEPFYLKFLSEWNNKPMEVTALVRAVRDYNITLDMDYSYVDSNMGKFSYAVPRTSYTINMTFEAVGINSIEPHIQVAIKDED